MEKSKIIKTKEAFDSIINHSQEFDIEFWYARDLMPLLGYERWENFERL